MSLIHSSAYQPRVYAYKKNLSSAQIDRVQDMSAASTYNRERIREVGSERTVDWIKRIPSCRLTLRQFEYGNIAFWRQLANDDTIGGVGQSPIDLVSAFKTSMVDIAGYKTNDDGTFVGTVWYPNLRVAGWGINIGDPQSIIERNFDLIGEDEKILANNNRYLIYKTYTATESGSQNFTISDPNPAEDPDNSGFALFRVTKFDGANTTDLTYSIDYTYNIGTRVLNIINATAGDIYKVFYSASTYIMGQTPFTNNDSDVGGLDADSCTLELETGVTIYKLQSAAIDVTYDRADLHEIGNTNVIARGARDQTVRITLGRIVDTFSLEETLRGVSSTHGLIDPRKFLDNISLNIKIYTNETKGNFSIGYRFTNLSPTGIDAGTPIADYLTRSVTLEGNMGHISSDIAQF